MQQIDVDRFWWHTVEKISFNFSRIIIIILNHPWIIIKKMSGNFWTQFGTVIVKYFEFIYEKNSQKDVIFNTKILAIVPFIASCCIAWKNKAIYFVWSSIVQWPNDFDVLVARPIRLRRLRKLHSTFFPPFGYIKWLWSLLGN